MSTTTLSEALARFIQSHPADRLPAALAESFFTLRIGGKTDQDRAKMVVDRLISAAWHSRATCGDIRTSPN